MSWDSAEGKRMISKGLLGRVLLLLICLSTLLEASDWPTFGHDPQRSGWASEEDTLSAENVRGLELKWQTQVDNVPLALNALMPPVVAANVVTPQGVKTLVYVAGSSDTFFALDTRDGKVVWTRTFETAVLPKYESFYLCPNAVNATPTIEKSRSIVYTIARDGKLYGVH